MVWFLENDLLVIGIFGEQPHVSHARVYPSGHITQNGLCSMWSLVHIRLSETCLFIPDCLLEAKWHNLGCYSHCYATDDLCSDIHVYIVRASSYEYKDDDVAMFPFPS